MHRDSAQALIATATLYLAQNGGKACGASTPLLGNRAPFTISAERERDKIDNVFTVKFGRAASVQKNIKSCIEIIEQQAQCHYVFVKFRSRKAGDARQQFRDFASRNP